MTLRPDWIAVDWGTSALRCWAMAGDQVLDQASSDQGMGRLTPDAYEATLLGLIEPWLHPERVCPVLAAGMVGARQGWVEAPYRMTPCTPVEARSSIMAPTRDGRIEVRILPGLCQADPADVMRGEEVQIAGVLARWPDFDGVICLPGTHSKWASVADGQVKSFRTAMTGELFELLATRSVLRHSVADTGIDMDGLRAGLDAALAPDSMMHLFALRAESLLGSPDPVSLRSRLSGILIGQELQATRPLWQGRDVVIVASGALENLYRVALEQYAITPRAISASEATLAGLCLARSQGD